MSNVCSIHGKFDGKTCGFCAMGNRLKDMDREQLCNQINYLTKEVKQLRGEVKASWDRHHETAMQFNDVNGRFTRLLERCKTLRDKSESIWFLELDEMIKEAGSGSVIHLHDEATKAIAEARGG